MERRFQKSTLFCLVLEALVLIGTIINGDPLIPPEMYGLPVTSIILYLVTSHIFGVLALVLYLLGWPRRTASPAAAPRPEDKEDPTDLYSPEPLPDTSPSKSKVPKPPRKSLLDRLWRFTESALCIRIELISCLVGVICFLLWILPLVIFGSNALSVIGVIGIIAFFWPLFFHVALFALLLIEAGISFIFERPKSRLLPLCLIAILLLAAAVGAHSYFSASETASTISISERNFVASSQGEKFHKPGCRYADNILSENKVYYKSRGDALADGKTPCSVCKP